MDGLPTVSPATQRQLIEIPPGLRRQFYYPVVLLDVLGKADDSIRPGLRLHSEPPLQNSYDIERIFRGFVDKLALICQNEPNGDAVTAATVLQAPDKVLYVFASNNRTKGEHAKLRNSVKRVLELLHQKAPIAKSADDETESAILSLILLLNRARIKSYLRKLGNELDGCIRSLSTTAQEDKAAESASITRYTSAIKLVLRCVDTIHSDNNIVADIRERLVNEERLHRSGCWYEFCHIAARLSAYKEAVTTFYLARDTWPVLFEDFEIIFIDPTKKEPSPLMGKAKTAQQLLRSLTSDEEQLERYKTQLDSFQRVENLDDNLQGIWEKASKLTVHAEIQLHHWLENTGGTLPHRFFNMYPYIGSSKPTCKLCAYYFDEHQTDVKVRDSHGNIYSTWAYPPVYEGDGEFEGKKGKDIRRTDIHRMKKRIVADIFRLLTERVGNRRVHDSTDRWQESVRFRTVSEADILSDYLDNLTDILEDMSISEAPGAETNNLTEDGWESGNSAAATPSASQSFSSATDVSAADTPTEAEVDTDESQYVQNGALPGLDGRKPDQRGLAKP
ncbi:hypothetical protein jhhlp_003777 [Lomentospora prolificans]|uniref:Uncharacterized protein n=1 Tax=Lomentospora prolificans TaxID=41688 RepID=A0A2N3N9P8_9PEZI|nr:hypothetical protein jhhlp_003777 [Lomentospora prolificans]